MAVILRYQSPQKKTDIS